MLETKKTILDKAFQAIRQSLEVLRRAAADTHANSTSAESKAEGKYDTRGVEAAYLAEGQAEQVAQLEQAVLKLESLEIEDEPDTVLAGSLVVVSTDSAELNYLILPAGAGMSIEHDGEQTLIITPTSPLGSQLLGSELGASIEIPDHANAFISEIY